MFIGRLQELHALHELYKNKSSSLAVLYGRRRIGKSELIKEFCKDKKALLFEGVEGERTPDQISHFIRALYEQTGDTLLKNTVFKNWDAVFDYLTLKILDQKTILVFDEFQWMAAGHSRLVSLLKYYWDNRWKNSPVMLILCGSISSFMIGKVIRSKALYGRIHAEIGVKELSPSESRRFLAKRSPEETLTYLMLLGGVPHYLEQVNQSQSLEQNIQRLCFRPHGLLVDEFEKIFYGQFPEARSYLKIVKALQKGPLTLLEISKKTKIVSGGGLSSYLANLLEASFIREMTDFGKKETSKFKRYQISDAYLQFYFKYIQPHLSLIRESKNQVFQKQVLPQWKSWLGLAFERFCLQHAFYLAGLLGFEDQITHFGPFLSLGKNGLQIDLYYQRADKITVLVEIKFHQAPIETSVIPEIEQKIKRLPLPRGQTLEKALISLYGPTKALKQAGYFHHFLTLEDILGSLPPPRGKIKSALKLLDRLNLEAPLREGDELGKK